MPNGRSGGYRLPRTDFQALLDTFSDEDAIAHSLRDDPDAPGQVLRSPPELNITRREVLALLDRHDSDDLYVEEQDGSWYIVHIDVPKRELLQKFHLHSSWLMVSSRSPLFAELRARHSR